MAVLQAATQRERRQRVRMVAGMRTCGSEGCPLLPSGHVSTGNPAPIDWPGRYKRTNDLPALTRSAVLFMDVLGTKELTSDPHAEEILLQLDRALAQARTRSQIDEPSSWADSAWFSDNLAIAAPLGDDPVTEEGIVGSIIVAAMWLQYLLAIEGFFARGGFTVGNHFMDGRVNFGPALVHAVELQTRAVYPRIILSDEVLAVVACHETHYSYDSPFEVELMKDQDGSIFISYLAVAFEADDSAEAVALLERHRSVVVAKLREHRDHIGIWEKYAWTASYHNAFCGQYYPLAKSLLVDSASTNRTFSPFSA